MILPPLPPLLITLGISLLVVALGIVWLDARRANATKTTQSWYGTVSGRARGHPIPAPPLAPTSSLDHGVGPRQRKRQPWPLPASPHRRITRVNRSKSYNIGRPL